MKILKSRLKLYIILATYCLVMAYVLFNLDESIGFLKGMIGIISPFIVGIGMAFVLNQPMKFIEKKLLVHLDKTNNNFVKGLKRPLAILLTFVFVTTLLIGLVIYVLPQFLDSLSTLTNNIPKYLTSLEAMLSEYLNNYAGGTDLINEVMKAWKEILDISSKLIGIVLSNFIGATISLTSGIVNFILSVVFTIYMLSSKEKLCFQLKKFMYAYMKKEKATKLVNIGKMANDVFSHFISGQCIEAFIIGALCFIGMTILRLPYALLISVVVGATSLIPIFGAFIGTIPGVFIILMINPMKAVVFIVFILILQQFEGNVIYPRVVGSSVGLSAIWVMLSMLIGGNLFGLLGFLLGIPTCAVLYRLLRTDVNNKFNEKNITLE